MIPGIYLAAGSGERFGSQKLLSIIGGRPVIIRGLESCLNSGLSEIIVVLGFESEKVDQVIREHFPGNKKLQTMVNPDYKQGIISSFNSGLSCIKEDAEGAMMILADMPFIKSSTINRLIGSWRGNEIVMPELNGKPSHPRIFPADIFPEFLQSDQFISGKEILFKNRNRIKSVVFENDQEFRDIDTKSDLMDTRTFRDL